MVINPMMYRVFLQDEKDAPDPNENAENCFRIRSGEMLAWTHATGNYTPTIESQLRAMDFGPHVGPLDRTLDGHLLIVHDGSTIGIVHEPSEIPEKAYELAKREAERLKDVLSRKTNKPYEFIDLTSRGDRQLAESLSIKTHNEYVETGCVSGNPALCVDIGD